MATKGGKDSYYPQQYKNSQGGIESHYIWESELRKKTHISTVTGEKLTYKNLYFAPKISAPMIRTETMTSKVIYADRRKRATEHFKKEVLPTVNKKDQAYFKKKHNIKQ